MEMCSLPGPNGHLIDALDVDKSISRTPLRLGFAVNITRISTLCYNASSAI